ncbi:ATP/GTP-binding protein [Streptomyces sp. NPDC087658]|uniref:AAA family ATPase n=1 Tax=Streptomyces sp. NPDC087658 TaxID=3365800 RepID=UPI0037F23B00
MLLRFRVANHRSIRDERVLSLIGTALNEGAARDTGLRHGDHEVTALPVVGVFGANGSGKTNLMSALRDMRAAVRTSFADWQKYPGVPRKPFKLDRESVEETSLYEVDSGTPWRIRPQGRVRRAHSATALGRRPWCHRYRHRS